MPALRSREPEVLKLIRTTLRYSQQEWAWVLALSDKHTIWRWETGRRKPSIQVLAHIRLVLQKPEHLALITRAPDVAALLMERGWFS